MYKLTVKITDKESINETVVNDFKTVEDTKKRADEFYKFAKENGEKQHLAVSRNNWTELDRKHFCSTTICNTEGNSFTITFTVEKQ